MQGLSQDFHNRAGCNMGCKTLFSEPDNLPLKLTCRATLLNKCEIGLCPKTLLAERGKSESCSACPIAVFCLIHLQRGKWLCFTLQNVQNGVSRRQPWCPKPLTEKKSYHTDHIHQLTNQVIICFISSTNVLVIII